MAKDKTESENYFLKNGTHSGAEDKKEKSKYYQRLEIKGKEYNKKPPSIIKYKAKLKKINE